ncbi:MAG TPA: hypothetical protein VFY10_01225 [Dehalococcoidia bacterium]|jgi:hypothetical protein|nr:hypothetical protein [Dehalococcoidia bacterium]
MQHTYTSHPEPEVPRDRLPSIWLLWFGLLAPPIAWAGHLSIEYFLTTLQCQLTTPLAKTLILAVWPVLVVIGLVAGVVAYLSWRKLEGLPENPAVNRARFMAVAGMLLTGLFVIGLVYGTVPIFVLDHCRARI